VGREQDEHGRTDDARRDGVAPAVLELAKQIQADIDRLAADPSAPVELLAALIDGVPAEKRTELAQTIFEQLPIHEQWAVLERVFDDEEIRSYLEAHRAAAHQEAEGRAGLLELVARARRERRIDTRDVAAGEELALGLFRDGDVRAAVARGHTSSTCARRLALRALGDGRFQVIADTFNPNGGYFVTAEYSADTWRDLDRLDGHAVVRVGSITAGNAEPSFEPVLYPAGRVDVEVAGAAAPGRLHLGFAMLSDLDIFSP
jgi:hypothetical protein